MLDHRSVVIEDLAGIGFGAPGCGNSFYGEKIFRGIRNPVQRPAIVAALNFFLGGFRLL
jgi:hypothetical protein